MLSDEEKIQIVADAFSNKISSFDSFADLVSMLSSLTKNKLKTFIRTATQRKSDSMAAATVGTTTRKNDLDKLDNEISNW